MFQKLAQNLIIRAVPRGRLKKSKIANGKNSKKMHLNLEHFKSESLVIVIYPYNL